MARFQSHRTLAANTPEAELARPRGELHAAHQPKHLHALVVDTPRERLLVEFPQARAVATPDVVKGMCRQISPDYVTSFWRRRLPGQIPERLTVAKELRKDEIDLEGHKLIAVNLGHTDTADTTCLHMGGFYADSEDPRS